MYDVCGAGARGLKCGYCPSRCLRRWGGREDLPGAEESLDMRFGPARGTVAGRPPLKTSQVAVSGLGWLGGSAWSLGLDRSLGGFRPLVYCRGRGGWDGEPVGCVDSGSGQAVMLRSDQVDGTCLPVRVGSR